MFSNASNFVEGVDTAFVFILGIIFFFLIGLTIALIYFSIKYKASNNPEPEHIEGNTKLEIIWTVIPLILVLGMFWFGWKAWKPMEATPPEESLWVETTARMWTWSFKYPNGIITDTLYVPTGKPIALDMKAADVIHSLYIPAFRLKKDIVPGTDRDAWFIANSPGEYDLFCTEYCGLDHSGMITIVKAVPEKEFDQWYATNAEPTDPAELASISPVDLGKKVVKRLGCVACHSETGTAGIGPSYLGLYGKEEVVIKDGKEVTITIDEEYLKRSILDPNAEIVKGFQKGLMVSYEGQLTEEELGYVIEYIKSIQ